MGNAGDVRAARQAAESILGKLRRQLEVLRPRHHIPFASFVRYGHSENVYWNEHAVKLDDALALDADLGIASVPMFPGDRWAVGGPMPERAVERWTEACAQAAKRAPVEAPVVSVDTLMSAFAAMQKRVRETNDWDAICKLSQEGKPPASLVYVTDLAISMELDLVNGLSLSTASRDVCDIRLGSQAFEYAMRHNWGRGTLTINGRFEANYSTMWRFLRQTQIPYANNIGWRFPFDLAQQNLIEGSSFLEQLLLQLSHPA